MKRLIYIILFLVLCSWASAFNTDNLSSEYRLDTNSNDYGDLTNHGTTEGANHATGIISDGLMFDGNDDVKITAPTKYFYNDTNVTINAWLYINNTFDDFNIFDWDNNGAGTRCGLSTRIDKTGYIASFIYNNVIGAEDAEQTAAGLIVPNKWYMITWVFGTGNGVTANVTYYINGTLTETDDFDIGSTLKACPSTDNAYIGTNDKASDWANGTIDELTIWNRPLSTAEIQEMYTNYTSGVRPWYVASGGAKSLYVNGSYPTCSDTYTRAENNLTHPWCSLEAPLTDDKMLDGDTLYITRGEYNKTVDITGWTITTNITITAYPGDEGMVNITSYETDTGWTQIGATNEWHTTETNNQNPRIYLPDNTKFFNFKSRTNMLARNYPYASWRNTTTLTDIHVDINDGSNPNTLNLRLADFDNIIYIDSNTVTDNATIRIANLTFTYIGVYGIEIHDTSNVVIENCDFIGGHNPIYIDGSDNSLFKNIEIQYCSFDGKALYNTWYGEDCKDENEETDMIRGVDFDGNVYAHHNIFTNTLGSISLSADDPYEFNGTIVAFNNVTKAKGSSFEIENYCYNSTWFNNTVYDSQYAGVSWAPADSSASPNPCTFHHNVININQSTYWNAAEPTKNSYAIKVQYLSSLNVSNWYIFHNSFYAQGDALSSMDVTKSWADNITLKDNIFYSDDRYAIYSSGLYANNVIYDYNLYYEAGTSNLLQRYDSLTDSYATLAAWLISVNYNGLWDTNSMQDDPLFTDINTNLKPIMTSPVCGAASDGTDIGALPCEITPPLGNTNLSEMYPTLTSLSFTDNFQHYTGAYPYTNRWTITNDATFEIAQYPTSYGYDNYMMLINDSTVGSLYATNAVFDRNTDDYEIIVQLTPISHVGISSNTCWLETTSTTNGIFYYGAANQLALRYYDGSPHNVLTGVSWALNDTKWLRLLFNHTTGNYSYYYKNNTPESWSYLGTYNDYNISDYRRVLLRVGQIKCGFDNVVARTTNNPEAGGTTYPSFLYNSLNDTIWYNATIDWYNASGKIYSDYYTYPTDYTDFTREIYNGVWYVNITLCDIYGMCINDTSDSVTFALFNVYPCSVLGTPTINFTITHEDFPQTLDLVADVEISGDVWLYDNPNIKNNYNFTLSGNSNYALCFYPDNYILKTDMYIKYYVDSGFWHRYIYVNQTLNDDVQYLTIYNFNYTTGLSDLVLTIRNKNNYQYIPNIIGTLQRWYVGENTWRNVQMDESGTFGLMIFDIYEKNIDYRILFKDRDNYVRTLELTDNMKFYCTGGVCELTYLIDPNPTITAQDNFTINIDYDKTTHIINISWLDPDGVSFDINNIVRRIMFNQTLVICNDTTEDTTEGYYECDISGLTGTFLVTSKTSRSPWVDQISEWIEVLGTTFEDITEIGRGESVFWSVGIITTMVMFGAAISPVVAIAAAIISLIIVFFLKMLSIFTIGYLITVVVIGIVISIKVKN